MTEKLYFRQQIQLLKENACRNYHIAQEKCHLGHLILEALLERPDAIHQIDAANDERETASSVAKRSMRLANAMEKYSLKPGDAVIIMGLQHIHVTIPLYACNYNGYAACNIDTGVPPGDLQELFPFIKPKMVFCETSCIEKVKDAFKLNNMLGEIITFDDKTNDLETFITQYKGTDEDFKPALFDQGSTIASLMLTSGTTGLPKVAMFSFLTLLNSLCCWWDTYNEKFGITLSMGSLQWLSGLIFFLSTSLRCYTRLQCSKPLNPTYLIGIIKQYRPNATAWTPFLLNQFCIAAENGCDLSSFQCILIGGGMVEKATLEKFQKLCPAYIMMTYSMTELMVPIFHHDQNTPDHSIGLPLDRYEYMLVDDEGKPIYESDKPGELLLKSNFKDFFKGYLNNPEETKKMINDDGWFTTGDVFYRDKLDYFYFVERKRLLIRHKGLWIPPLQLEEVIKTHPGVAEACVVGIPDPDLFELAVGLILRRNGNKVEAEEIFELLQKSLPPHKQLLGGIHFVDQYPTTASGKINRSKARELALTVERILPKKTS